MSAATASIPTPSAMLRRPAPAAACAPAPEPISTRIRGTLLDDAYSSTEPATGRAAFTVVLSQGLGAPDIVATRWVGEGPEAALHARDRAAGLRAGDTVEVHGGALRLRYRDSAMALQLCAVRDVELVRPSAGHDAEEAQPS